MSHSSIEVRPLGPDDAEALFALRRTALVECPFAFAASPEDDRLGSIDATRDRLSDPGSLPTFGAFADDRLVGMVGLYRERKHKTRHKVSVVGLYVHPDHRRQGQGARLVEAAIACAEAVPGLSSVHLTVSDTVPEARRLYELAGFVAWGLEPDALRWEGQAAREYHMALMLPRGRST